MVGIGYRKKEGSPSGWGIRPGVCASPPVAPGGTTKDSGMRLVTRADFDGLACGVLLKEIGLMDNWLYVHLV